MKKAKIGQSVLVLRRVEPKENFWSNVWVPEMDESIGQILTIESDRDRRGVMLSNGYLYPHFVLANLKTKKQLFPNDYYMSKKDKI